MNRRIFLAVLGVTILITAGFATFSQSAFVSQRHLRFDFYPHWLGGRTVWAGETPYTLETTQQIQRDMFGELLRADEDQQNFAYPAYTSILIAPVIALPAPTAIALWMALQLTAIMWIPIIWLAILGWKPSPITLCLLVIGFLFVFHYPLDTFALGQFSGTVLLGISLGVWFLMQRNDIAAGAAFVIATVPPTIGGPIVLAIMGAFALRGRWRALATFIMIMALVTGFSILRIGWWIPQWINIVRQYADYAPPVWVPSFLPSPIALILVGVLMAYLGWSFYRFWKQFNQTEQVNFVVAVLLVGLLLLPQTGYYYLVLLIPVIVVTLAYARELPSPLKWRVRLSCILAVISPWFYFSIPGHNPDIQGLILPLHVGLTWVITLGLSGRLKQSAWSSTVSSPSIQQPTR
ncbi:MAG: DUF2029 domain-containing protein [Chloroflexi bacterium]|nr:DUF2029 domain-containing protein [Chloroflexota bacterium]MCC6894051.1 DUF2029 domain-containing protein [Anaerolineae bacterium]